MGATATVVAGSESASATRDATNASIAAQQSAQQRQEAGNAPYAAIGTGTPGTPAHAATPAHPGIPQLGIPASAGTPATAATPGTTGAIQQYQNLLGLGPQGTAGIEASLAATPGYQFAKNQGMQATLNAATLTNPGAVSGNTLEALDRFSTGLADSTYQNALGNAQNAVTIGQNAAAGTGAGILQTGANVGSALINQGNTIAGINANQAAGLSKVASGAASNYATLSTLNNLNSVGPDTNWISGQNNLAAGQIADQPVAPIALG